jgi:hypothetical protein
MNNTARHKQTRYQMLCQRAKVERWKGEKVKSERVERFFFFEKVER